MVTYATDTGGSPIFLFSDLSDHTQNLLENSRAAFLIERASHLNQPQAGPRLTLMGKIRKTKMRNHISRFLNRHPKAKIYANFSDFNYYRMVVTELHFVGGFATSEWFKGSKIILPASISNKVSNAEKDIIDHMNFDHQGVVNFYANVICKRKGSAWKLVGVDCDGVDLACASRVARLNFKNRVNNPEDIKKELINLAEVFKKF